MNTTQIIGIVIAAVVVLGGGYYVMTSPASTTGEEQGKLSADNAAFSGSFFDLAARGGNYKCDISSTGTDNSTTGTSYIDGGNLRGDFVTVIGGKSTETHMLKVGDDIYMWSDAMPQGIKMKAAAAATQGTNPTLDSQVSGMSGTQSYGWNCSAVGSDASRFEVPTDITFTDMEAMMQGFTVPTGY